MKTITASALREQINGKKILVDTNIIIYLTDAIQPYEQLSRVLFEMVEHGDVSAVFSIITIAEVMQGPTKKGRHRIAQDVKNYLLNFPNTHCQEITADVLEHIGRDKRIDWAKLRTVDSLIIASGLEREADLFISNDDHFRRAVSPDLVLSFRSPEVKN